MTMDNVNILLVDDQPAKLVSLEAVLKDAGRMLFKASSAREALEILLKNDIAVVLTDVCMPELDGFDLAKMLRAHPRYENTAVIFVSAVNLTDRDLARGYQLGAVDYVTVPVVPEILRAKVRVFVDLYRKTRELEHLNAQLEHRVHERTVQFEETNARLRESEERLRLASEAAEFGTYDYNLEADSIHCSAHLKRLLHTDFDGQLGLDAFLELIHEDDRGTVREGWTYDRGERGSHEIEFRPASRKDRWLLDRGRSFKAPAGSEKPGVRTMGTILDITVRKKLEDRQKLLVAELDHRVKNVMANIAAMSRFSSKSASSVEAFVETLDGRLQSMANAHVLLSRGHWNGADLMALATAVLAPFRSSNQDNISLEGDPIELRPRAAQDLALVLHELATNAVKHGALSVPGGAVDLHWTHDSASGTSRITWREKGGPPVREPARTGLGLRIMETALSQGGNKVTCSFHPSGLVCTIEGPLGEPGTRPSKPAAETGGHPRAGNSARASRPDPTALTVLVVEDEPFVSIQLQSELEHIGHAVVGPAANLASGLALAHSEKFDCALLDVNLGRETSVEIADELIRRDIPFAFVTGYTDGSLLPEALRDRPRIAKPHSTADLARVLRSLRPASDSSAA